MRAYPPAVMVVGRVLAGLPRSEAAAVVRDGSRTVLAFGASDAVVAPPDPFAALDGLRGGWWAGFAAYELGHAVERVEPRSPCPGAAPVPDLALVRFAARVDRRRRRHRDVVRHRPRAPDTRAGVRASGRRAVATGGRCDRVDEQPRPVRLRTARPRDPGADPGGRVLSGEPHPPARRPVARSRRAVGRGGRRQPRPARDVLPLGVPTSRVRPRWCPPRPSGSCASTGTPWRRRPIKGTARRRGPPAIEREGPGRERDDRGPRPQRSRAGVRAGHGHGPRAVPARSTIRDSCTW